MAELEIHHEGHEHDPFGQKVGILTSVLAVMLAIVTIASHRAHTKGVLLKADENDKWSYYQSKRIKFHNLELGEELLGELGAKNEENDKRLERYKKEKERYTHEAKDVQDEAVKLEEEVKLTENRALRYDFGEGLIEIAVVLSSLYFIAHKKYYPLIGLIAGLLGIAVAASGLLV